MRKSQKPSAEAIVKIADYFDVSTDYLLTGKEKTGVASCPDEANLTLLLGHKIAKFVTDNLSGDLTQDELDDIAAYILFIKQKRKLH